MGKVVAICLHPFRGRFLLRDSVCAGTRLLADRRLGALERLAAVRRFADCGRFEPDGIGASNCSPL